MTEIDELLWKINKTPSFLAEVDWCRETDWFDEGRMMLIIKGIKDDEVCKLVRDYIAASWYDACDKAHEDSNIYNCVNPFGEWLYVPVENDVDQEYELLTIEDVMNKFMVWRKDAFRRQTKKQTLEARAREIENSQNYNGMKTYIFTNTFEKLNEELKTENEKLKNELQQRKKECKNLREALSISQFELLEKERVDLEKKNDMRNEVIREFVQQLIIYAENFPSNQNDKAEVIKQALLVKEHNGFIPSSVLDEKWNERLMNLGRKEPPGLRVDKITANNLYDVHNNGEVNLK